MTDRFADGEAVRRAVLGDAHVDRARQATTSFDASFQRYITENVWGDIWGRPGLNRRERSLITLAILAALGHDQELAMHVRATANTGTGADDIGEVMLHVAAYAGVPAANRAIAVAKRELAAAGRLHPGDTAGTPATDRNTDEQGGGESA